MDYFARLSVSSALGIVLILAAAALSFGVKPFLRRRGMGEERVEEEAVRAKTLALALAALGAVLAIKLIKF